MDRLFRDWRHALLWVIGISAIATAFLARGGRHEELQAKPQPTAASPAPAAAPVKQDSEDSPSLEDPLLDPTGFDPNPPEPSQAATPENPDAAAVPAEPS